MQLGLDKFNNKIDSEFMGVIGDSENESLQNKNLNNNKNNSFAIKFDKNFYKNVTSRKKESKSNEAGTKIHSGKNLLKLKGEKLKKERVLSSKIKIKI